MLLFRLINMGDLKAVRELIKAGDPYQLHHQNIIEKEIQECDQEVAESEESMAFLRLDLVQKVRHSSANPKPLFNFYFVLFTVDITSNATCMCCSYLFSSLIFHFCVCCNPQGTTIGREFEGTGN